MTQEAKKMDDKPDIKIKQGRSPAYPYIKLEKAIERIEQVNAAGASRTAMVPETFYSIWKLGASSSGARQVMAALNQYGLVEYVGRGSDRKVILSDLARKIVLDKIPNSPDRAKAIRDAALQPGIYASLWEKYGQFLPDNVVLESFLARDMGYNQQAAKNIAEDYRDTFNYAGLTKPDNITNDNTGGAPGESDDSGDIPPEITVGDYIQWESDGALQFDKPRQVRAIQEHDGVEWVFVKGSKTGIPMNEAIFESKGVAPAKPGMTPPTLAEEQDEEAPASGSVKAVCPLEEGNAILILPKNLSKASYEDLEYWFKGELRKAARKAKASSSDDTLKDMMD